jgi:gas vesicle protein
MIATIQANATKISNQRNSKFVPQDFWKQKACGRVVQSNFLTIHPKNSIIMNQRKVMLALGLGLLAGSAAGYYLASEDGKKFRKQVGERLKDVENQVRDTVRQGATTISDKISGAAETAKNWVSDLGNTAKENLAYASDKAENAVEDAENSFNKGVDRAKSNIQGKAKQMSENASH